MSKRPRPERVVIAAIAVLLGASIGIAQSTAFTYQGRLTNAGVPASGPYDMRFLLFDTADVGTGTQQGAAVNDPSVQVASGIFSVELDFGAEVFDGSARYLEIGVRTAGSQGPYTTLSPRRSISSTPYSVRSVTAAAADGLSAVCVNCVTSGQIESVDGTQILGAIPVESVPTGSGNYIQNSVAALRAGKGAVQDGGFDISGDGTVAGTLSANIVNAGTQYNIGGSPVLSLGSGVDNLFVGAFAGQADPTGSANSFFGTSAGFNNSTGTANSFFGRSAGFQNTTGGDNSFFGVQAGRDNSTGSGNSFFGRAAGMVNSTGAGNSFFGWQAGGANTTGVGNSFYGDCAGCSTTSGSSNSFFGTSVALQNVSGRENSFFGFGIGGLNTNGIGNSFFGYNTAQVINLGSGNSFFGSEAGQTAFTSVGNSLFGYGANLTDGIARATAIGISALVSQTDSLVLGAINGVNGATFDTLVGIGTTAPQQILHVNGSEILSTGPLSGFKFRDRGSLSSSDDWVLYSQSNIARLFRQGVGDLFTIRHGRRCFNRWAWNNWNHTALPKQF